MLQDLQHPSHAALRAQWAAGQVCTLFCLNNTCFCGFLGMFFRWKKFLYWIVSESGTTLITPHRPHKIRGMLPKEKDWVEFTVARSMEDKSKLMMQFCVNKVRTFCFGCMSGTFTMRCNVEIFWLYFGEGGKSQYLISPWLPADPKGDWNILFLWGMGGVALPLPALPEE